MAPLKMSPRARQLIMSLRKTASEVIETLQRLPEGEEVMAPQFVEGYA